MEDMGLFHDCLPGSTWLGLCAFPLVNNRYYFGTYSAGVLSEPSRAENVTSTGRSDWKALEWSGADGRSQGSTYRKTTSGEVGRVTTEPPATATGEEELKQKILEGLAVAVRFLANAREMASTAIFEKMGRGLVVCDCQLCVCMLCIGFCSIINNFVTWVIVSVLFFRTVFWHDSNFFF